jgi:hypothetical protein
MLALTVFACFWAVPAYVAPSNASQRNEVAQTLAQVVGGSLLLLGLYFTWRTVESAEKTLAATREGQIADRYAKAIEQLGSDNVTVRLGGIYSLERLALDSDRDYGAVIQMLAAFVRQRSPWPPMDHSLIVQTLERLPEDVQTALTVLGRRPKFFEHGERHRLDLTSTDLRNADLAGAHFEGAELQFSCLDGVNLIGAHLSRVILWGAWLRGAKLMISDLRYAFLNNAHLEKAYFFHPSTEHFEAARKLGNQDIAADYAKRFSSKLPAFEGEVTEQEGRSREDLLAHADFTQAHLDGAELKHTDLRQAVGLTAAQIASANADETTFLPKLQD